MLGHVIDHKETHPPPGHVLFASLRLTVSPGAAVTIDTPPLITGVGGSGDGEGDGLLGGSGDAEGGGPAGTSVDRAHVWRLVFTTPAPTKNVGGKRASALHQLHAPDAQRTRTCRPGARLMTELTCGDALSPLCANEHA